MTTGLGDMINRFEALIAELESELPIIVGEVTQDAIALIEERITMTGKGPSGTPLKAYTKPYQKLKENPKKYKRGQDLGIASSRFTGHTDYTLTGLFWKDVQLISVQSDGDEIKSVAGVTTQQNKYIMESLTDRDGFPLRVSEEERQIVVGNAEDRVRSIISKYFEIN